MPDLYTARLEMHKLGYTCSDIFKSALEFLKEISMNQPITVLWNNTVSSPGSLQATKGFKESWKVYVSSLCRERPAVKFIPAFLTGYTSSHERYINIYTQRTTQLLTLSSLLLVTLEVIIQNKKIWWFMSPTLHGAFVQGIVRVGYSPSLLLLWTIAWTYLWTLTPLLPL